MVETVDTAKVRHILVCGLRPCKHELCQKPSTGLSCASDSTAWIVQLADKLNSALEGQQRQALPVMVQVNTRCPPCPEISTMPQHAISCCMHM